MFELKTHKTSTLFTYHTRLILIYNMIIYLMIYNMIAMLKDVFCHAYKNKSVLKLWYGKNPSLSDTHTNTHVTIYGTTQIIPTGGEGALQSNTICLHKPCMP